MKSHNALTPSRRLRTIRFQLLFAVNLPLAVLVAIGLIYDYRNEMTERLDEVRVALEDEAKTLLPAVVQLHHHGIATTQQYIDTVCGLMQTDKSPGHHIAVRLPTATLQATAHKLASPEMLAALQHASDAPTRRVPFENTELIVGIASGQDVTVYVAEKLTNVKHAVRTASMKRLAGVVVISLVAALIVNVVLIHAVTNPIQRLVTTVHKIGGGQLGVITESFRSAELNYLAREIDVMSASLAEADRDRKAQMAKAREIQQSLLPREPSIPGLHVAHLFEPAEDIGGDFYDILLMHDGAWLICVADVTGHGIPAAMSAAMLKTQLLQAVETHTSPAELLDIINRRFAAVSLLGDFVSIILLRVEPFAGRLQYASAGHEPGWLVPSSGDTRELSSTGLLLGIDDEATWENVTIEVTTGDRLFIFTDGVSETFNAMGKMFGRKRLHELFESTRESSLKQTTALLSEALIDFRGDVRQQDDITALLLEFNDR